MNLKTPYLPESSLEKMMLPIVDYEGSGEREGGRVEVCSCLNAGRNRSRLRWSAAVMSLARMNTC